MNCPKCGKVMPITKKVEPINDAVACTYCRHVVPAELMVWSDGKFHFTVLGDVTNPQCRVKPRILMKEQTAIVLDIPKLKAIAIQIINREPNLRCICGEFEIKDSDIRIELLTEEK
jgi:hypothetical protein